MQQRRPAGYTRPDGVGGLRATLGGGATLTCGGAGDTVKRERPGRLARPAGGRAGRPAGEPAGRWTSRHPGHSCVHKVSKPGHVVPGISRHGSQGGRFTFACLACQGHGTVLAGGTVCLRRVHSKVNYFERHRPRSRRAGQREPLTCRHRRHVRAGSSREGRPWDRGPGRGWHVAVDGLNVTTGLRATSIGSCGTSRTVE
ncbi:hypothetical protein JCM9534A_65550 [Catenuloplanes indicus JCM 9534]|uniref:Uncharacterized protein n=1 Tax=Catenuloplanes indicus TaxID=137267 RepID=A0AAE3W9K2_9ACTN|nr:hypothetical protein [Catenuloplanes indicus]